MLTTNQKLEKLKQCLGEKKLKQLGLIPCLTCTHIKEQAATFIAPSDMDDHAVLTSEEVSNINKEFIASTFHELDHYVQTQEKTEANTSTKSISIEDTLLDDEASLLTKLATILVHSQPTHTSDLGNGYLYTYPSPPLPHAITCPECGKLYSFGHSSCELTALQIYLTDTEYELIKGLYVDTFL